MVTIEIKAIRRAKIMDIRVDEDICVNTLCECIRRILGDKSTGFLINAGKHGFIAENKRISEYGIGNGTILIYISGIA